MSRMHPVARLLLVQSTRESVINDNLRELENQGECFLTGNSSEVKLGGTSY